jgi:hypothetical protein
MNMRYYAFLFFSLYLPISTYLVYLVYLRHRRHNLFADEGGLDGMWVESQTTS